MSSPWVCYGTNLVKVPSIVALRFVLPAIVALGLLGSELQGQTVKLAAPAAAPASNAPETKKTDEDERQDNWNTLGFAVPFDRKVIDRFRELNGYLDEAAWSKAFRLLADLDDSSWKGMLPDEGGFLVPAGSRLSQTLLNLSPEGRAAFRIFFDPTARRLMESLQSGDGPPGFDIRVAESVYRKYFLTDSGDEAADLLGDAYFQQGEFLKAERCWRSILENHPDSSIPEVRLLVKRGVSLIRAGDADRFAQVRESLQIRFPGEQVTLGGKQVDALEYLDALAASAQLNAEDKTPPTEKVSTQAELMPLAAPADDAKPLWQFQFRDAPKEAEKSVTERTRNLGGRVIVRRGGRAFAVDGQTFRSALTSYVPSWDTDGRRVYLNWLGACCAIDVDSGQAVWRTEDFRLASQRALGSGDQINYSSWMNSPRPFPIVVADGVVVGGQEGAPSAGAVQQGGLPQSLSTLTAWDATSGKIRWKSETNPALQASSVLGIPVIRAGEVYVVTQRPDSAEWVLRTIDLQNGSELWSVTLGSAQLTGEGHFGISIAPTPTIHISGNRLYILTNNGGLLCVNCSERELEWVYKFETAASGQDNRMIALQMGIRSGVEFGAAAGSLSAQDGLLYFKEGGNRMLYALDPLNRALAWSRPVTASSCIVAVDDERIYLLSDDLMAVNRETRALLWSIRLPATVSDTVLLGKETVLVPTSRGIYELSRKTGDRRRIFRGEDVALVHGNLGVMKDKYLCVSNLAITAYDATAGDGLRSPESNESSSVRNSK